MKDSQEKLDLMVKNYIWNKYDPITNRLVMNERNMDNVCVRMSCFVPLGLASFLPKSQKKTINTVKEAYKYFKKTYDSIDVSQFDPEDKDFSSWILTKKLVVPLGEAIDDLIRDKNQMCYVGYERILHHIAELNTGELSQENVIKSLYKYLEKRKDLNVYE